MEHKGEIVRKILSQKGINLTKMADDLGMNRTTLYNQLDRADMFDSYILKIGEQIGYDFSKVIKGLENLEEALNTFEEERVYYGNTITEPDELDVTIKLDGTEDTLKKVFDKLTRVNKALSGPSII